MKKLFELIKINVRYFLHFSYELIVWLKHYSLIILVFVACVVGLLLSYQEVFMGIHRFPDYFNRVSSLGASAIYLGSLALLFYSILSAINYRGWKKI